MAKCTICGRNKGWFSRGWKECQDCHVWYCPECKKRLKTKGLLFKQKICVRCGHEV